MKRPLQLSLAIALALGVSDVLALGLGPVRVHSRLNQPLNAEIPILQASPGEADGLLVSLAAAEDFERIGLSRSRVGVPLKFVLGRDASGAPVIKVSSEEPVRQAYLDFLVEANWPKGRLLREYTVLLDPPITAPVRAPAPAPAPRPVAAPPARPAAPPPATPQPAPAATTSPVKEVAAPVSAPAAPPPAAKPVAAPAPAATEGEYGPVEAGDTLSRIARATRPDENLNRTMLAFLKANPNAFFRDNINALKRGAILRVPDAEEIRAVGSAAEAAAQVQAQVEDWRGQSAAPARSSELAATAATAPKGAAKAPAVAGERLELVPPKAGKEGAAVQDRPSGGTGDGTSAAARELRAELARVREALTSSEQESTDLKSRVRELEEIKKKNDRLLVLKDSEIAALQDRLKEMEAAAQAREAAAAKAAAEKAQAAVTSPAPSTQAPAASPEPAATQPEAATETSAMADAKQPAQAPIGENDIWGSGGQPEASATQPGADAAAAAAPAEEAAAEAGGEHAGEAATASGAGSETAEPVAAEPAPAQPAPVEAAPVEAAPAAEATAEVTPPAAPAEVPATAVAEPEAPAAVAWYQRPWFKFAAPAAILLALLGWLGLRRRAPEPAATRKSLADEFGESPLSDSEAEAAASIEREEATLRERLEQAPDDVWAYLELLSIYYARRDVEEFEQIAARMHSHITDEHQAEWLEVQAMGQELAPHNPLFGQGGAAAAESYFEHEEEGFDPQAAGDEFDAAVHADVAAHAAEDFDGMPAAQPAVPTAVEDSGHAGPAPAAEEEVGFGFLGEDVETSKPAASVQADPFADLPPLEFGDEPAFDEQLAAESGLPAQAAAEVPAAQADAAPESEAELDLDSIADETQFGEDFFSGGDAVATKLDLARAYMDMGDPEGARSMLEEVAVEGNDEQQAEARRLMSELG